MNECFQRWKSKSWKMRHFLFKHMETYSETSVWRKHAIFYLTMRKRCKTCAHIANWHICGNRMYTAMRIRCWYLTQQFKTLERSESKHGTAFIVRIVFVVSCTLHMATVRAVHRIECNGIWHSMCVYLSKCAELDILLWDIHSFSIWNVLTGQLT